MEDHEVVGHLPGDGDIVLDQLLVHVVQDVVGVPRRQDNLVTVLIWKRTSSLTPSHPLIQPPPHSSLYLSIFIFLYLYIF